VRFVQNCYPTHQTLRKLNQRPCLCSASTPLRAVELQGDRFGKLIQHQNGTAAALIYSSDNP
jgi:hypothetical protein